MTSDHVYSVNELIERLPSLHGMEVQVAGILRVEFEDDSLWHYPRSERWPDHESGLWANYDLRPSTMSWDEMGYEFGGRYVRVTAIVDREPMNWYAGRLLVLRIVDLGVGDSSPWPYRNPPPLEWRQRFRAAGVRRRRGIAWDQKLRRRIKFAWAWRPRRVVRRALARWRIWAWIYWLGFRKRMRR